MSNNNSNNSNVDKTFTIAGPVLDGTIVAKADADKVLYLSYQILAALSGTPVDVTLTLVKRNDSNAPWFETGLSVNFTNTGINQDFLEVDLAKSEQYALRVTVTAGSVDSLKIWLEVK